MLSIKKIFAAFLLLVLLCGAAFAENTIAPAAEATEAPAAEPTGNPIGEELDLPWYLILVNNSHPVPDLGDLEGVALKGEQMVDRRMYPYLQKMFDDYRAQGGAIRVNTSYRTIADQEEMVQVKFNKYKNMGHNDEEAMRLAYTVAAKPGFSEHHTGLAVDVVSSDWEKCTNEECWAWMAENCQNYGFILRFPEGKEHITGISYEPWHFRYVGAKAAKIIMAEGLTLEEYLEIYYDYT